MLLGDWSEIESLTHSEDTCLNSLLYGLEGLAFVMLAEIEPKME